MYCTNKTVHDAWKHQIKRIQHWMLRIFFSATIGFVIPLREFWSLSVIGKALLFSLATFGKILTGVFALPLEMETFFIVGFSMAARGEFAFLVASTVYSMEYISHNDYASIVLAVLISVVLSPWLLDKTLTGMKKRNEERMEKLKAKGVVKPVCYQINLTGLESRWSHHEKMIKILKGLKLGVLDLRTFHSPVSLQSQTHRPYVSHIICAEVCNILFFFVFFCFAFVAGNSIKKTKNKQTKTQF